MTFVTPVAPYHTGLVERVKATVRQQTVQCGHIVIVDEHMKGAGWARNKGLEQVSSPFICWLDADDLLEPAYAERVLSAYDGKHYIYTDWFHDEAHINAPEQPFVNGSWHVVTALLPTAWVKYVGGFDETLAGGEDTDLYLKLRSRGMCGRRLAEPLMHYTRGGRRSHEFVASPALLTFQTLMSRRYGGKQLACCGEYQEPTPVNERESGAVLVQALWEGNRQQRGAVTGKLYPRAGNGALMWVDARDVSYSPHLWMKAVEAPQAPKPITDFQAFAAALVGAVTPQKPAPMTARINPLDEPPKPNLFRLLELYGKAVKHG